MSDDTGAPDAYDKVDFSDHEATDLHEGTPEDPADPAVVEADETDSGYEVLRDKNAVPTGEARARETSFRGEDLQWVPEARDAIAELPDETFTVHEIEGGVGPAYHDVKGEATAAWVNGKSLSHDLATPRYAKPFVGDAAELQERAEREGVEPERGLFDRRVGEGS